MGPAPRVMSLRDGTKKMSKSDPSDQSRINLNDDPDTIALKIRRAKTDPEPLPSEPQGLEKRPEARNLVGIYAALAGTDHAGGAARARRQGLRRVQGGAGGAAGGQAAARSPPRRSACWTIPAQVDAVLRDGAERAAAIAEPIVAEAERLVGFCGLSSGARAKDLHPASPWCASAMDTQPHRRRSSPLSIPMFNEAEVIGEMHRRLAAVMATLDAPWEVIYVNDGSRDATLRVLEALRSDRPPRRAGQPVAQFRQGNRH